MSLKGVRYTRLETDDSEGDDDESPPQHVSVSTGPSVKGSRWNHIDNLDEFFEQVYEYQQKHGFSAIIIGDVLELIQFLFIVIFTTFVVTCLRLDNLWADTITYVEDNVTEERDVVFEDLFDIRRFQNINGIVVIFLVMAFVFWIHRLLRALVRSYRFWNIRTFYRDALHITTSDLPNVCWADVVQNLKEAQREHKMNIQKQELSELDIYHRILRFKNYTVAMVNKGVIQCRFLLPLYGEKVFFTQGLKFNYELILFWPSLKAPFKNSFYLREEYKSAANKHQLVKDLQFRITVLALLNFIFCPAIFLYQLIYSFFSYTELLKNQPGVFGRRRWSLYGQWFMRDFNELEHEFALRRNRAYKPSVKYMDLFLDPLLTILAKNVAFIAGSLLAVLVVLTVIQEDLLTAHNVLKVITVLGLTISICRIFIPSENQVYQPTVLMKQILGEIHYMPDKWKLHPHSSKVHKEFTHIFQFTMMYVIDELLSPLVTPFILYFWFRPKAADIVDFLRNFTIDVSGVGDICSFAEMNVRKHGNPEWMSEGVTAANQYEQAELGKTEISLMHFSRKHPDWKPSEDGVNFMTKLKESVDDLNQNTNSGYHGNSGKGFLQGSGMESSARYHPPGHTASVEESLLPSWNRIPLEGDFRDGNLGGNISSGPQVCASDAMQWSIWSAPPNQSYCQPVAGGVTADGYVGVALESNSSSLYSSTMDTLQIHRLHDLKQHSAVSNTSTSYPSIRPRPTTSEQATPFFSSHASSSAATFSAAPTTTTSLAFPFLQSGPEVSETVMVPTTRENLKEPLLRQSNEDTETSSGNAQISSSPGDGGTGATGSDGYPFQEASGDHTVVELH